MVKLMIVFYLTKPLLSFGRYLLLLMDPIPFTNVKLVPIRDTSELIANGA